VWLAGGSPAAEARFVRPPKSMETMIDFSGLDGYLCTWDQFAQGRNELASELREHSTEFERDLTTALTAGDRRAPSRLVFYLVVQVAGFVALDTPLGAAVGRLLGPGFQTPKRPGEPDRFLAGDVWSWWLDHREQYDAYPLLTEWGSRDFARTVVLPMYERVRRTS
jgi:hypothetical protein